MSKSNAWDATSWEELAELVSLEEVCVALRQRELNRGYHKTQYLKRQALLAKAKEAGITLDD